MWRVSGRWFPEEVVNAGAGVAAPMRRITCAHCGAVAYHAAISRKSGARLPPEALVSHFMKAGWAVGNGPRKDFCPHHSTPAKRRKIKEIPVKKNETAPKAEPPREITREDRRIINDKLDEVYGEDAYKAPWTDAAVAKDLGVPVAWVSDVREQFFGAAGSNPLLDEYLAKVAELDARLKEYEALRVSAAEAATVAAACYAQLCKDFDSVRVLARRVEREVGR